MIGDIVERQPHAVLERPDRLMLIDAAGVELEPVAPEKAKGMLRLAGPGAGKQIGELVGFEQARMREGSEESLGIRLRSAEARRDAAVRKP